MVVQRKSGRLRLLDEIRAKAAELTDLLTLFGSCTLCGECLEVCPLTPVSGLDMQEYGGNTPEYVADRLLDMVLRSESCVGCGMCEAVCHLGLPLMLVTQMLAESTDAASELIATLGERNPILRNRRNSHSHQDRHTEPTTNKRI